MQAGVGYGGALLEAPKKSIPHKTNDRFKVRWGQGRRQRWGVMRMNVDDE